MDFHFAHVAFGIRQLHGVGTVTKRNKYLHRVDDVFLRQGHRTFDGAAAEARIHLHAADAGKVIRFRIKEETVKEPFHGFFRGGFAGTHHAVDGNTRREFVGIVIQAERVGNVGTAVQIVREERFHGADLVFAQRGQRFFRDFFVGVDDLFAGGLIKDGLREHATDEEVIGHREALYALFVHQANVTGRDALILGDDQLAFAVGDVELSGFALQTRRFKRPGHTLGENTELIEVVEMSKDFFGRQTDRLQKDRTRHLAATIHTEVDEILRIEFEIQPGAAVGNHARGEEQLPGGMRLTLVVLEENTGRTVQLAHDNAFATVDDEGRLFGHERNFAHVDVVFADFFHRTGFGGITVKNFQTNASSQSGAVGETAQLAFRHIKFGLLKLIVRKSEAGVAVVARDREDGSERSLQAVVLAAFGLDISLKEIFVAAKLHFQQGRHFKDARTRSKTLPNAFLFSERVRHGNSVRREGEKNT